MTGCQESQFRGGSVSARDFFQVFFKTAKNAG